MPDDPKEIVRAGYDAIADRYAGWRGDIAGSDEAQWVDDLLERLPAAPTALELGCGAGSYVTTVLGERGDLLGVDISAEQLRSARERHPRVRFMQADFTQVDLDPESFDAVVSVYALNHVPRADLPRLLSSIGRWLKPGGYFFGSFGRSGEEGVEDDWLGVPMFFGSFTEAENRELVGAGGLDIRRDEVITIVEPEYGEARFQWILARKS